MIPFLLVHVASLGVLWTGITAQTLALCVTLYVVRMFAVTGGYHRYFSHRTYKTSRVIQFLMAFVCQTSAQRGVIWWAAKHREHHKHSDTPLDIHSPRHHGFWFSHVGWIFAAKRGKANYRLVGDLTKYPELVWLGPPSISTRGLAGIRDLAGGRMGCADRRFHIEHRAVISRNLCDQFTGPCNR